MAACVSTQCFSLLRWLYRKGLRVEQAALVPSTPTGWEAQTPTAMRTLKPGVPLGHAPALTPAPWVVATHHSRLSRMTWERLTATWCILERQGRCPACLRWLDQWANEAQRKLWRACWITWTCCLLNLLSWTPRIPQMLLCFTVAPTAPLAWPHTHSRTTVSACTARWGWTLCPLLPCRHSQRQSQALGLMRTNISAPLASSKSCWPQMPVGTWCPLVTLRLGGEFP